MNKSNEKSKPKFLITSNKQIKLSVQIPQKTDDLITDYRKFHKEVSGEEVTLDALISAVISSALTSDKSFIQWKKEQTEQAGKSETEK